MTILKSMLSAVMALAFCRLLSWADNSAAASVGDEGYNSFGFAQMFTPQANFTLTGVSLQVTGYSDFDPGSPQNSTLELYLSYDTQYLNPSYPYAEPANYLCADTATINAATGSGYDFNIAAPLMANTPYWLSLFLVGPDGSYGISASWDGATLVGDNPAGIVVDGYESGVDSIGPPYESGTAFPIGVVPEPVLMPLHILGWIILLLSRARLKSVFFPRPGEG
jgi:hypothetical protein